MNKKFAVLLVGILMATMAFANGNVVGTVFLSPGGPGAEGATVTMHRNMHPMDSVTTVTDAEGHFGFQNITSGGWHAIAILEGHLPGFGMVFVPDNNGTATLDIVLGPPLEDTGSVTGTVLTSAGDPAAGAMVRISQMMDPQHPHGFMLETMTDAQGAFSFDVVPAGIYNINAGLMGEGFAAAVIEVVANQTTTVTLTLSDNHHGGEHHGCDSLVIVDLTGTVIVMPPDTMHPMPRFLLDVDADGAADYRLSFGPPWYDPNGPDAPNRPQDGDEITVRGGLLTYGEPPMVVVFQINGMFWREPCHHGGHGGGHHGLGCDPDSISAIEVEGSAMVETFDGPHGPIDRYAIDTDADGTPNYALMFGPPSYDPNGDAEPNRPADGDAITIVGGLMDCDNLPVGVIIVYEINGMFWREPGDTSGFSAYDVLDAGDPVGLPVTYLTASNYPNPFNPATLISYTVPTSGNVTLKVYDIVGREVATLVNANLSSGMYSVAWDASNMPSGIYVYQLKASGQTFTNKMVLMK